MARIGEWEEEEIVVPQPLQVPVEPAQPVKQPEQVPA